MRKTRRSPSQPINSTKIAAILIILAIVAFQWYQNNRSTDQPQADRERVAQSANGASGEDDPYQIKFEPKNSSGKTVAEEETPTGVDAGDSSFKDAVSSAWRNKPTDSSDAAGGRDTGKTRKSSTASRKTAFLQPAGGNNLKSPAGLIYGMGSAGEHRVDHVLRHAEDDPGRPSHGVFDGDKETILQLLDEAYEMIKAKSKYVKSESSQGNTAYTISMGRRIGYEGGEKGDRNGNQALRSVRLVLDGNRVITAYPYR